ncbi:hypothetical protein [Vannielia sp. SX4]|uniref:hypothetical protein n=1 Tax=Vannielia sp. SX4 TaxID=3463852 RepID=UPI0040587797
MITKQHLEEVDYTIGQLMNLSDALSVVGFELAGLSIPDTDDNAQRNAACGVIESVREKVAELSGKYTALYAALNDKEEAA